MTTATAHAADCGTCDVLTNWVAASAVGYEEARNNLRAGLRTALGHGVTVADLASASGRGEEFITQLITEGSL
jgi:hypothetical protein